VPGRLESGHYLLDIEVAADGRVAQVLDRPADGLDALAQSPQLLALPEGGDDSLGQRVTVVVHPGGRLVREGLLYLGKGLFELEAAFDRRDDGLLLLRPMGTLAVREVAAVDVFRHHKIQW